MPTERSRPDTHDRQSQTRGCYEPGGGAPGEGPSAGVGFLSGVMTHAGVDCGDRHTAVRSTLTTIDCAPWAGGLCVNYVSGRPLLKTVNVCPQ